MISRNGKGGFFAAHYDWIAAAVGALALAAGAAFFIRAAGGDAEAEAQDAVRAIDARKPAKSGVKPVETDPFEKTLRLAKSPVGMAEVSDSAASFLMSERRVFCASCHEPIPGGLETCPLCKQKLESEDHANLDTDEDGLPDAWEKLHGLDSNNAADAALDADADGFTNREEFAAKTDPKDPASHPDYLDSIRIQLPLKETALPFFLERYSPLPGGKYRLFFKNPSAKNGYGQMGEAYSALIGEKIGKTGFSVKGFEVKSEKREIKGSGEKGKESLTKTVDVSFATLTRDADGKEIKVAVEERRKPVDVQATLVYERGESKELVVVPGDTIDLSGTKFRVVDIKPVGKGATVTLENLTSGKRRALQALEQ